MGEDRAFVCADGAMSFNKIFAQYDANHRYVFIRSRGMEHIAVVDMHSVRYVPGRGVSIKHIELRTFKNFDRAVAEMAMRYDNGI